MAAPLFVLDVKEKETSEAIVPSFPQIRSGTSGFPEHKKRTKVSAFKQKRQGAQPDDKTPKVFLSSSDKPLSPPNHGPKPAPTGQSFKANEKSNIDRENSQRLASMSPQEIEQARQELFNGLDPSILQMLMKRANLDEGVAPSVFDQPQPTPEATSSQSEQADTAPEIRIEDTSISIKANPNPLPNKAPTVPHTANDDSNSANIPPKPHLPEAKDKDSQPTTNPDDDSAPAVPPKEYIINASDHESAHWPRAPQPADLDPSSPDFLQNLHAKYFPSLPADPSKLAWMAPLPTPHSPADRDSPYYPGQSSLPISALRFSFRGSLLPPRISRAVPVSKGLHHHGEAPEAAGYTIRELARLARSAVPGQRCIAYQTLGRILYRLGKGEWGGVRQDDVSMGIWREFEEGAVLRSLHEEVGTEEGGGRGHRSARAFATEAIWLLEKGGWKDKLKKA
ncbi:RPAP1-like protein [Nemania sp. FL0031]|nr:RPAP1-like protein [Nemania sp. FL0031]